MLLLEAAQLRLFRNLGSGSLLLFNATHSVCGSSFIIWAEKIPLYQHLHLILHSAECCTLKFKSEKLVCNFSSLSTMVYDDLRSTVEEVVIIFPHFSSSKWQEQT